MKVTLKSHVNSDGTLTVRVPSELNDCDVTVTVESHESLHTPEELGWPLGFFEQTAGALADDPISVDFEGNFEKRESLE